MCLAKRQHLLEFYRNKRGREMEESDLSQLQPLCETAEPDQAGGFFIDSL